MPDRAGHHTENQRGDEQQDATERAVDDQAGDEQRSDDRGPEQVAKAFRHSDILTGVLMVARLRPASDDDTFREAVRNAIEAMAARPGHLSSRLARALDDPSVWVVVSEWENVGSYRRALSSYDVKMLSGALMAAVVPEPTAFEVIDSV